MGGAFPWFLVTTFKIPNKTFGPSRVCRRHIKTPHTARAELDAILALSPERLVVSHGEVLRGGATGALTRAYAWLG
jgi:hypothetical protein